MKRNKRLVAITLAATLSLGVVGCASKGGESLETDTKNITVGVCPGPYGDMVKECIAPYLEANGYEVEVKEFSDYIQPDKALNNREIDTNLMQHTVYLEKFSADNNLDISAVISVPTAGMGIFSNNLKSLSELGEGGKVAIPNDPSNLARALTLLEIQGLIKIDSNVDDTKATKNDITENSKNLEFLEVEAAQLARSISSADIALVPGNYAIASGLDFAEALAIEELSEEYKNVVAVRTEDLDKDLGKDLKEAVESEEFRNAIESGKYKDFNKPEWYVNAN